MATSVLLDSSVWIELFKEGPLAQRCERSRKSAKRIIVPTVVLFEVYRKLARSVSEEVGLMSVAHLTQHSVQDLNRRIALTAADLSVEHKLGMADSMVLAHAYDAGASLVTLDNDFAQLEKVTVIR